MPSATSTSLSPCATSCSCSSSRRWGSTTRPAPSRAPSRSPPRSRLPPDRRGKTRGPGRAKPHVTQALAHLRPVTGPADEIDAAAAERAAHDLLRALGVDLAGESLRDTRRRMARMYAELLTPAPFNPTTFPNDGGYDERPRHELLSLTGGSRV